MIKGDWQYIRDMIRVRSKGKCERCGKRPYVDMHHTDYPDVDAPENLLAVCRPCHKELHTCTNCGFDIGWEAICAGASAGIVGECAQCLEGMDEYWFCVSCHKMKTREEREMGHDFCWECIMEHND